MRQNDPQHDAEETESADPWLSDRVEASDDFLAVLEQSIEFVVEYRRIFFLLLLVSIFVTAIILVSRYLL